MEEYFGWLQYFNELNKDVEPPKKNNLLASPETLIAGLTSR